MKKTGPGYQSSGKMLFDLAFMNEINSDKYSDISKLADIVKMGVIRSSRDAAVAQWGLVSASYTSGVWSDV